MTEPGALTALDDVDVLIVGAGISGIGLGCHLSRESPGTSFAIVDGRDAIGGTWDLFRFPGVRSDSDLFTLGYEFKPWVRANAFASAAEILEYLHQTIDEYDLARYLHLGHTVLAAQFSSEDAKWKVTVQRAADGAQFDVFCRILFSASGYYDYSKGHTPEFAGRDDFRGQIIHPQFWPENFDCTGKKVVVIGSGATAVTLIPAIAGRAEHVTMLQRSPSYVLSWPREDRIANGLRRMLSPKAVHRIVRKKNIRLLRVIYRSSRRHPDRVRRLFRAGARRALPNGYPIDLHFNPSYEPWDQRLCVAPDSDLFDAIAAGNASVVTDRIVRFTESGILLESGTELEADVIVTATGLELLPFGGIDLRVDGEPVNPHEHLSYKGMMVDGVPNFAFAFGYTNSSWTLKIDLVAHHLCRLLAHMNRNGYATVTPVCDDPTVTGSAFWDLTSGYLKRGMRLFPQQGSHGPWTNEQDYFVDYGRLRKQPVEHPALRFGRGAVSAGRIGTGHGPQNAAGHSDDEGAGPIDHVDVGPAENP